MLAVVTPPPQLNVAPLAEDEAIKVSMVLTHVNMVGEVMLAEGVLMFCVTVVEAVPVHPLAGLVAVTL